MNIKLTLLLSTCFTLALAALAAPGDFNASPGYGTRADTLDSLTGSELVIQTMSLASETNEPGGQVLLTYNATVSNSGGGYHGNVELVLAPPTNGWPVVLVAQFASLPDLPPNAGPVGTLTPVSLRCAAADAVMVKTNLQAKQHVHVDSVELFQFTLPVVAVDLGMDLACRSVVPFLDLLDTNHAHFRLEFTNSPPSVAALAPGKLLIENPALYEIFTNNPHGYLASVIRSSQDTRNEDGKFRKSLHLEITSVTNLPNGSVQVEGTRRETLEVLRAATYYGTQLDAYDDPVRDPYNPPVGSSYWPKSEADLRFAAMDPENPRDGYLADTWGLFCLHYALNDIQIARGITLDGELLLRGLNLSVNLKWREAAIKKLAFTFTSRAELDLRLTAEAGSKNDGDPLFAKEKQVVWAPLPPVVIPIGDVGLVFQPELTAKVGCSLDARTRVVVPMQSSAETGLSMSWDDSRPEGSKYQYDPIHKVTPLAISEPTLAQAVSMTASAWAEAAFQVKMNVTVNGLPLPVSGGPELKTHVQADFTLTPLGTPWWALTASADVTGNLNFRFLGFEIADPGVNLFHVPDLLTRQATTPPAPVNGPLDNAAGDHVRWARAVKSGALSPYQAGVARVAGTAEDVFIALHSAIDKSVLMRVNARGDLVWSKGGLMFGPDLLASTPDGGVLVAGHSGSGIFLSKHDGSGNLEWTRDRTFLNDTNFQQNIYPAKVLVRETGGGAFDIFVAGYRDEGTILVTDPFLMKYDSSGTLLWAKHYASPDAEYVADAAWMPNGNIVLCGWHKASPDGTNAPGAGTMVGGWLMTLDPSGDVRRTARTDASEGVIWKGVTTAPDGTIYTAGLLGLTVVSSLPAFQVGAYDTNLNLLNMVTLGEGLTADARLSAAQSSPDGNAGITTTGDPQQPGQLLPGLPDFLPTAGATSWDSGQRILWTPAGIIVLGTTALANNTAAYTLALNDQLSVRWMLTHERFFSEESLLDLVATDDGIVCVGNSAQFFDVSTHNPAADNGCALILKLPFEGKIALHPGARGIDKYLQPLVHDSVASLYAASIPSPDFLYHRTTPLEGPISTAQVTAAGNAQGPLSDVPITGWIPLEAGNANAPMTYAQWAAYNHLPTNSTAQADFDGDGRSNGQEWFFGGNPFTVQSGRPTFALARGTNGTLTFTFPRSHAASGTLPLLQASANLLNWDGLTFGPVTSTPLDAYTDQISVTLPRPDEPTRFFRLQLP